MDQLKTTVIILNFNGLQNTLECIESLEHAKTKEAQVELVVVDNNSQDGSQEALSQLKYIHLIENQENLGFSGGNNIGIKYALSRNSDQIIVLNNDTTVDKSFLTVCREVSSKADIISPKICFAPGYEFHIDRYSKKERGKVIWYAGGKIDWDNIVGIHYGVDEVDHGQFNQTKEISFATGACMIIKSAVFEEIGFFDEKYFLYLEDMDFCVRAKFAGFKIIFEPKVKLWHKNAQSVGSSGSALQDYYISRNRLLFAYKYAKLRTKLAVFKQIVRQSKNPVKRQALLDFFTLHFGAQ